MRSSPESNEMQMFRDSVQQFLATEIAPHYNSWEKQGIMPREVWNTMGEAGLLCVDLPQAYGSVGANIDVALMIQEEMSLAGYGGLCSGYNIQSLIVAHYINNVGSEAQKQQWLPGMVSGDVVASLGMTEPNAGSDVAAMRTRAVRDGDDYLISGSKIFITNGIHADLVVVCAKTDKAAGAKGISLFLVDTTLPGFSRGKQIEKIGQHCSDTAELFFDELRVPASAMLGPENHGFFVLMDELPRERLGCATQAISAAQGALNLTVDYVQQREAFGQTIGQFQNTRFKLAEIKADIVINRAMLTQCMEKLKRGELSAEDAAILKFTSTEMQCKAVDTCLQLFGGYGYTVEYPISRFYVDARIQTIYAGSSEIMKEVIARGMLGR